MGVKDVIGEVLPLDLGTPSTLLALMTFLILLSYFYQAWSERGRVYPPGPPGLPILGSMLSLVCTEKQQHEVIYDWTNKYGPIITFKVLDTRVVVISDIDLVQKAFSHPGISDRRFPGSKALTGRDNCGKL